MMSERKNIKPIIGLVTVCALAIALGIWVGVSIVQKQKVTKPSNPVLESAVQNFEDVLTYIERHYVDSTNLQALSETAVCDLLRALDPHSTYLTAREVELNNAVLKGELAGVGIEFVMLHDIAYVIAPVSGGPAARAGIKSGDKIIKIDDKYLASQVLKQADVSKQLRGTKGTKVRLTVQRNNEAKLLDFTITRDKVPYASVDVSYMVNSQVGYIKISRFTTHTFTEFKTAFYALQKQGMSQLLLDFRGNLGGHMNAAIKIANDLLDQGQLIVYTKGQTNKYNTKYYAKGGDKFDRCPIIMLVDEGTSAAAEIVVGALQDNDRALIVGRRTFGKGLVQASFQLADDAQLRLTVARYYTPSGRFIQKPHGEALRDSYSDLIAKYKQGEYFHVDNIEFDDVLKYQTSRGRTVYGGGGIMPDYFIPVEVLAHNTYHDQLQANNILQQSALEYIDQHRKVLTAMNYAQYYQTFEVSDLMLKKLIAQASKVGLIYDDQAPHIAEDHIKLSLKALIARNIWSEQGYYPIYHQKDNDFQRALQLFDEAAALLSLAIDERS
ncbi:MAG: S41 family peptidase [Bacteroidota bacterium]